MEIWKASSIWVYTHIFYFFFFFSICGTPQTLTKSPIDNVPNCRSRTQVWFAQKQSPRHVPDAHNLCRRIHNYFRCEYSYARYHHRCYLPAANTFLSRKLAFVWPCESIGCGWSMRVLDSDKEWQTLGRTRFVVLSSHSSGLLVAARRAPARSTHLA